MTEEDMINCYESAIASLEEENDALRKLIMDIWNADPVDQFNAMWEAHDFVKQSMKRL